jgi:hypothetical protein
METKINNVVWKSTEKKGHIVVLEYMIERPVAMLLALPPHVNSYVEQMKQYTELYNATWVKLEQELAKAMAKQHEIRYIVGCDPYKTTKKK